VSTNRPTRQGVRPPPKDSALFTPTASARRQAVERRSAHLLLYLHQLPRWVPPVVLAVLLVVGLAIKGPAGAIALCGVAAVLGWLASLSWPRLTSGGRAARLLVVAAILACAVYQATR
jgi:hypothetical protein